ncbi:protein ORF7 [Lake sturgeon herpesvirus]|nr:protein ORF7 [Lake sturgeon herpesvirus]
MTNNNPIIVRSLAKAMATESAGCFGILDRCPILPLTENNTKNIITLCQQVYGNYTISAYLKKMFPAIVKTSQIIGCMRVLMRRKAFTKQMQLRCIQLLGVWLLVNKHSGGCSVNTFQYLISTFVALFNCANPSQMLDACFQFNDPQCKADVVLLIDLNANLEMVSKRIGFLLCEYAFSLPVLLEKPAPLGLNGIKCCVYPTQPHTISGGFDQLQLNYITPLTPLTSLAACPCIIVACKKLLNINLC